MFDIHESVESTTGHRLRTVRMQQQSGEFYPLKDCDSIEQAMRVIHFLNGGNLYDEDGDRAVVRLSDGEFSR